MFTSDEVPDRLETPPEPNTSRPRQPIASSAGDQGCRSAGVPSSFLTPRLTADPVTPEAVSPTAPGTTGLQEDTETRAACVVVPQPQHQVCGAVAAGHRRDPEEQPVPVIVRDGQPVPRPLDCDSGR